LRSWQNNGKKKIRATVVTLSQRTKEKQHDTNTAAHTFAGLSSLCEIPSRTGEFPEHLRSLVATVQLLQNVITLMRRILRA
jgi:hypothetical protein